MPSMSMPSMAFTEGSDSGQAVRQELSSIRRQLTVILESQHELQTSLERVGGNVSSLLERGVGISRGSLKMRHSSGENHAALAPVEQGDPNLNESPGDGHFRIKKVEDRMKVQQAMLVKEDGKMDFNWSPDDEMRQTLNSMFTKAEEADREALKLKMAKRDRVRYWSDELWAIWKSNERFSMALDVIVSITICINAIFLGLSMDYSDGSLPWTICDLVFSFIFVIEICFKVYMFGFSGHFCGSTPVMNWFDTLIILVDFVQVWMDVTMPDPEVEENTVSASLFRMIRLIRLTRVIRVTKSDAFKDLAELIHGILAGVYTLVWSLLLFLVVLYVVALVFRETLGRRPKENIYELFDSVPRALFTTFRCSFGDCNSRTGVPIFEYVTSEYGPAMSVFYSLFTFIVAVVLFNVISAMFVESTMEAAASIALTKRRERMQDESLLVTRIATLVRRIMLLATGRDPEVLSEHLDTIMNAQVPRDTVDQVIHDPLAKQALIGLDINPLDHGRLSDIFDPDNGGTIGVMDIAAGIRRLRGEARRSDVVCIDLMIRHVQSILVNMNDAMVRIEGFFEDSDPALSVQGGDGKGTDEKT